MQNIEFSNARITMAGDLFLPENFSADQYYPAIVCVHPGGGVKEQTAGLYAEKLAAQGFVTLAFDASHQGESGGIPRRLEDPFARVEDIRAAVDYLSILDFVDADRIGAFGVCAGGGYAIDATKTDRRIKAVGTVSPVDIGATFRKGWDGSLPLEARSPRSTPSRVSARSKWREVTSPRSRTCPRPWTPPPRRTWSKRTSTTGPRGHSTRTRTIGCCSPPASPGSSTTTPSRVLSS
ncbi:alpha/beta hydrolase [Nocardia sp. NPDC056952]|uniref:alpha/beta hydrolase n=1 Tax=Nocardia sp. NPDC056952 TaxID=3345979 RepID=UPI003625F555